MNWLSTLNDRRSNAWTLLVRRPQVFLSLVAETVRRCCGRRTQQPGKAAWSLKDIWKVAVLSNTELDYLAAARAELAPPVGNIEYCGKALEARSLNDRTPVRRVSDEEYADYLANPVAYQNHQPMAERMFRVEFVGLENLEPLMKSNRPVMFIAWHNGAQTHNFLRDLREHVPSLEVFSAYREVFTPYTPNQAVFFTTPLMDDSKLGMLRMAKCMEHGKPILHYFDGIAGKRDLGHRLFGAQLYFSRGFIHLARACKPAVIPIAASFTNPGALRVRVGASLFSEKELQTLTDEQILDRTLRYFVNELKEDGPTQLAIGGHLTHLTKQTSF